MNKNRRKCICQVILIQITTYSKTYSCRELNIRCYSIFEIFTTCRKFF